MRISDSEVERLFRSACKDTPIVINPDQVIIDNVPLDLPPAPGFVPEDDTYESLYIESPDPTGKWRKRKLGDLPEAQIVHLPSIMPAVCSSCRDAFNNDSLEYNVIQDHNSCSSCIESGMVLM